MAKNWLKGLEQRIKDNPVKDPKPIERSEIVTKMPIATKKVTPIPQSNN